MSSGRQLRNFTQASPSPSPPPPRLTRALKKPPSKKAATITSKSTSKSASKRKTLDPGTDGQKEQPLTEREQAMLRDLQQRQNKTASAAQVEKNMST